jgi:hypothetical protein
MANPFGLIMKREDEAENAQLGRFVTAFTNAKTAVHMLARKLSGMPDAKARLVFGGMRLGDLTDRIRAMMRLDNVEAKAYAEVDACLSQLNLIAKRRHRLLHRASTYFAGEFVVTDVMTARSIANVEVDRIVYNDFSAMYSDCLAIFGRLSHAANPANEPEPDVRALYYQPWRYIPVLPETPNRPLPIAPESQQPPPDASQA